MDSGDVKQLSAQMERLMESPVFSLDLARNGFEKMRKEFTWAKVYDQQEAIYEGCEERVAELV